MADLPSERLKVCPPFTYVGLDVFGPWSVTSRRTRGGQAESKRWAIMFCCMSSRAVHTEIIESMDTSSCINALQALLCTQRPCGNSSVPIAVPISSERARSLEWTKQCKGTSVSKDAAGNSTHHTVLTWEARGSA